MDWTNFQAHGQSPNHAFEAFANILFERYMRKSSPQDIERIIFINGAGGDGGVESLASFIDGSLVGVQAKWFRESISTNQIGQIRRSIQTALQNYPSLIRYFVAVPRDLANPKRKNGKSKTQKKLTCVKKQCKTERMRWDDLVKEFQTSHPKVKLELWDETTLASLLTDLGSDGLYNFWFQKNVIEMANLQTAYDQARSGWLRPRYSPDYYVVGQIETDLDHRTNGLPPDEAIKREFSRVDEALCVARREATRLKLKRFSFSASIPAGPELVRVALDAIASAIEEQKRLFEVLEKGPSSTCLPTDTNLLSTPIGNLLKVIPEVFPRGIDPTRKLKERLRNTISVWAERSITPARIEKLRQPVIYIGDPGSGKTCALASAVGKQLAMGVPALLVRSRDINPHQEGIHSFLSRAFDLPGWTHEQILDACEASAVLAQVREVAKLQPLQTRPPFRFLIAFDGLDESPWSYEWMTRLGEMLPLAKRWPRISFAFSMRNSLAKHFGDCIGYSKFYVGSADASLPDLFKTYTSRSQIECPPVLRWALGSPLSIRLFAELYERKTITKLDASSLTMDSLLEEKLKRVEASLLDTAPEPWDKNTYTVWRCIKGILNRYVERSRPLSDAEVTDAAMKEQSGFPLKTETIGWILGKLRDSGILRESISLTSFPDPPARTWEPAYEALTDHFLAKKVVDLINSQRAEPMPDFLPNRPYALDATMAILGSKGFDLLAAGLWSKEIPIEDKESLQRVALLHASEHPAGKAWAKAQFTRSMPSCRLTLTELIIPGLRLPDHGYGGLFVHEILVNMSILERDQFWSTPDYFPTNHGAPWEGEGEPLEGLLEIEDDDVWDGMPLVAAWAFTSCNNDLRRVLRSRLAKWAADKPAQLRQLLEVAGETNDPQMLEDLLWSAYGAAYLTESLEWSGVCEWINDAAEALHAVSPWNIEIEHVRRAILQFFKHRGIWQGDVNEIPTDSTLLPISKVASSALKGDLVWYVIPEAYRPFFSGLSMFRKSDTSRSMLGLHDLEDDEPDHVLPMLELDFGEDQVAPTRDVIPNIETLHGVSDEANFPTCEDGSEFDVFDSGECSIDDEDDPTDIQGLSEEAILILHQRETLLAEHAKHFHQPSLTAEKLAMGFVSHRLHELGWDKKIFIKDPRGGKPGEILGLDVAIMRMYILATHGMRSAVGTMAEKYCWIARHELVGYLARRLPAVDYDTHIPPPVDPAQFVQTENPATAIVSPTAEIYWPEDLFQGLVITNKSIREQTQIKMANQWVATAPLPSMEPLLRITTNRLTKEFQGHEWLVLHASVTREESETMGDCIFRCSAFATKTSQVQTLIEDAQHGHFKDLHEVFSTLDKIGVYSDPLEAIWAPWQKESVDVSRHCRTDRKGRTCDVQIQPLTCRIHWESEGHEHELYPPVKWLIERMGVVQVKDGRYHRADRTVVAIMDTPELMLVRADILSAILSSEDLTLCWGTLVYREPSPILHTEKDDFIRRDQYGISIYSGSLVESHVAESSCEGRSRSRRNASGKLELDADGRSGDEPDETVSESKDPS